MSAEDVWPAAEESNPFRQPDNSGRGATLHPVSSIVWAAVCGTPLAAGVVMAINYARMGEKTSARAAVITAIIATTALIALILVIPEEAGLPDAVFYVPQLIAVYAVANSAQGESIEQHRLQGGTIASVWPGIGIGLLCLPIIFGVLFAAVFLVMPDELGPVVGTHIEFGNDEIYYSGEATEEDARDLAELMTDLEFFGSEGGTSVGLQKQAGQFTFSFIVVDDGWDDSETVDALTGLGKVLIEFGYPSPIVVCLCDDMFTPHKTIKIE